jgi:urease accessory protein UreF
MNTKQVIATAVLALVGSSAAFAQTDDLQHFGANQASTVTRAAVRAEVLSALATGELATSSEVLASATPSRSNAPVTARVTRGQVKAELAGADLTTSSDVAAAGKTATSPGLTREAVRAEARAQARANIDHDKGRIAAGY